MEFLGIKRHTGCAAKESYGCFGPKDEYYTLFNIEVRHLGPAIVISLFIGMVVYAILHILKKKAVLNLHILTSASISLAVAVASLYILTYYFQFGQVQY